MLAEIDNHAYGLASMPKIERQGRERRSRGGVSEEFAPR
jgi:hypothetical protein